MKLSDFLIEDDTTSNVIIPQDLKGGYSLEWLRKQLKWADTVESFDATGAKLSSLEGLPNITKNAFLSHNRFTSLIGLPRHLTGDFNILNCPITTLEGGPDVVEGSYTCTNTQILNLQGLATGIEYLNARMCKLETLEGNKNVKIDGWVNVSGNQLTSLEHGPVEVGSNYTALSNEINTLTGFPQKVGKDFDISRNKLTNLQDIHKHVKQIDGMFSITQNHITSHVLGLLLIKNMKKVDFFSYGQTWEHQLDKVIKIINTHLKGERDVLDCKEELLAEGWKEFAKL